jgi:Na+/melibiose symporter-like transporter
MITVVSFKYFFTPTQAQPVGQLNASGYHKYAMVASVIIFMSVIASAIGTHNRVPFLRADESTRESSSFRDIKGAVRDVFGNRAYLVMLLAMLLLSVAAGLNSALGIYINTYFWELSASSIAVLSSSALVGVVMAFVVALPLSKRLGKKRGALTLFVLPLVLNFLPITAQLTGVLAPSSPLLLPILTVQIVMLTACSIGGSILLVSMVSDMTEQVRLDTGRQSEGLLFSLVVLINKAVSGLGVLFAGLLLTIVGFPEHAQPGQVPSSVVHSLVIAFVAVYLTFVVLGLFALMRFPITREAHEDTLRRLEATSAGALHEPQGL